MEQHTETVVDRFTVFEEMCNLGGVERGLPRIGVILDLPEEVAVAVWKDFAERVFGEQREDA
jgi:hypothetical protein